MKYLVHLILATVLCNTTIAQQLRSEKGSLTLASSKAKSENKPICLLIIPPENVPVPPGLLNVRKDSRITPFLNDHFINYIPSVDDREYGSLKKKYHVQQTPVLLFLDGNRQLLYRIFPNFKDADGLLGDLKNALNKAKSATSIGWYESEYFKGNRDTMFLKAYIAERESLGIYFNYRLVQDYADQLTLKEIRTVPITAYLLHRGMIYGSTLYNLVVSDIKLRDSAWASFPLKERAEINDRITLNTFEQAVKTKDRNLGAKSADYQRTIWSDKNYRFAQFRYDSELIRFNRAIKDTSRLLDLLPYYIERYYLNVTIDTLQKYKKLYPMLLVEGEKNMTTRPALYDPENWKVVLRQLEARQVLSAPVELNSAAWTVFEYSKDRRMLMKALLWSQTSIKLDPIAEFYDTLAHLLYRLEFYLEAERTQLKAIALAKGAGRSSERYKAALVKMREKKI
ncbi:hypothetical protein B0I27_10563 [Arcticibacter pallidicorallinus]|uniref:Thioredoxin-like protein n=1 Tax=Arcticibacter pallidicorallinus TaxID=1259464 RepID=A0A2T0U3V3_9SPHI|nr:hypothetical protein [Arcticibacter pallidicorallinus]PRY52597.1 hypothetical protein B0I27_10563 [Arcticibacter pallidicorallinus]